MEHRWNRCMSTLSYNSNKWLSTCDYSWICNWALHRHKLLKVESHTDASPGSPHQWFSCIDCCIGLCKIAWSCSSSQRIHCQLQPPSPPLPTISKSHALLWKNNIEHQIASQRIACSQKYFAKVKPCVLITVYTKKIYSSIEESKQIIFAMLLRWALTFKIFLLQCQHLHSPNVQRNLLIQQVLRLGFGLGSSSTTISALISVWAAPLSTAGCTQFIWWNHEDLEPVSRAASELVSVIEYPQMEIDSYSIF